MKSGINVRIFLLFHFHFVLHCTGMEAIDGCVCEQVEKEKKRNKQHERKTAAEQILYKFLGYLYRSLAIRHSIALVTRAHTRGNTINYADCKFTGKRQIKLHAEKSKKKTIFQ